MRRALPLVLAIVVPACGNDSPTAPAAVVTTTTTTTLPPLTLTLTTAPAAGSALTVNSAGTPTPTPDFTFQVASQQSISNAALVVEFRSPEGRTCATGVSLNGFTVAAGVPRFVSLLTFVYLRAACPMPFTTTDMRATFGTGGTTLSQLTFNNSYRWTAQ